MYKSVADEIKDVLSVSRKPKTIYEITKALGARYSSAQVDSSLNYWVKRGVIEAKIKDGYKRTKEYCLN